MILRNAICVLLLLVIGACGSTKDLDAKIVSTRECFGDRQCAVPFVNAHRGNCGDVPENTLVAFDLCEELGVPMLEVDVRTTLDGELVVMHDETTDRTTDGEIRFPGRTEVANLLLDEILTLVIDDERCTGISEGQPERCRPPTFAEVLHATGEQTLIFIDFKAGAISNLASVVAEANAEHRVILLSSDVAALRSFKGSLPNAFVMPRARDVAGLEALLDPANRDMDWLWIHGDEETLASFGPYLMPKNIRLYINVFDSVDVWLALAVLAAEPKAIEANGWGILDELVDSGAYGFGSDMAPRVAEHLYPNGFGR